MALGTGSDATGSGVSPEIQIPSLVNFYTNCSCCGSGSSGSGQPTTQCPCKRYVGVDSYEGFFDMCDGSPVYDSCMMDFIVTITFDFSECVGRPIGSCGSGSGSAVLLGSGSGSGPCLSGCPSCCDLIPPIVEMPLKCQCTTGTTLVPGFGTYANCYLASYNLFDPPPECKFDFGGGGYPSCYGLRKDQCPFFIASKSGGINFFLPIDNAGLQGYIPTSSNFGMWSLDSCDPVLITGDMWMLPTGSPSVFMPCLNGCGGAGGFNVPSCVKATFAITEA